MQIVGRDSSVEKITIFVPAIRTLHGAQPDIILQFVSVTDSYKHLSSLSIPVFGAAPSPGHLNFFYL